MKIVTLGPQGSHAWQAAQLFNADADVIVYPRISEVISAFKKKEVDHAVIPVYNTREGDIKEYFHVMERLSKGHWIDNVVLPIHLSLGSLDDRHDLSMLIGTTSIFRQCEEYIAEKFPGISLLAVNDIDEAIRKIKADNLSDRGVIEAEEILKARNLVVRERELASHNRTRFAVLSHRKTKRTGYDASALITAPLKDRVGLLFDILGELSSRGINLLDLRSETDVKTQEMKIYIEAEGHIQDKALKEAIDRIENSIIQEPGSIRILGSYPRLEIRTKHIETFGFIGTGEMSVWFAEKLENEGYKTVLTGRSTELTPEKMVPDVDVVIICVPISATAATVRQYGRLLQGGQALILLAGEAEDTLNTAMESTAEGVELMLVHNLWGPQAVTMKDKLAAVVRTSRSGSLCSEFEAFLYKHGADITHDTPTQHDLLMGVGQKLPTSISVSLAMTLAQNKIEPDDIGSHSTLTSLYSILAMSRVHSQNARTYAEILSTKGDGRKIVRDFADNLQKVLNMADDARIKDLCSLIEKNRKYLTEDFLNARMTQALEVDKTLGRIIRT